MSPAAPGGTHGKDGHHAAKAAPAQPAPAESTGLTAAEPPELPPFWVEGGRAIAEKWPLPVFVFALIAAAVVFLARPATEKELSAEEYVLRAQKRFRDAVQVQDERGDLRKAVRLIGGKDGVLSNYELAEGVGGRAGFRTGDYARIGEAYFRLAKVKHDFADQEGRMIASTSRDLYSRAASLLTQARRQAHEEASASARPGRERNAEDLDSPEWRRRRLMLAECLVQIGDEGNALEELNRLVETMSAVQAARLNREKSAYEQGAVAQEGSGASVAGGAGEEWARVYELMARCYDRRGDADKTARYYRLALEQGVGGPLAHRARLRLAQLVIASAMAGKAEADKYMADKTVFEKTKAKAASGFEEVCRLCATVEQSDAPAELREDATFLEGRAAYRLGGLLSDPARARTAYEQAARAFRYPYSPSRSYLDMSRVLLARSLFLAGNREEALEQLDTILRIGASPAIYACAEVTRADMFVDSDPAAALGNHPAEPQQKTLRVAGGDELLLSRLGLQVTSPDEAKDAGPARTGACVVASVVAGGPAEKAGVAKGDLVTGAGGKEVAGPADLSALAAELKPGTVLELQLARPAPAGGGAANRVSVKLVAEGGDPLADLLRLGASEATADAVDSAGLARPGACLVNSVVANGPADRAGIRKGDLLISLGSREIYGLVDLLAAAATLKPGAEVELRLVRPETEASVSFGYMDAARRIRRMSPEELGRLAQVPELAALLADGHFVLLAPEAGTPLPDGEAQLLRIARAYSAAHEFDEAARIYRHILDTYPRVAQDRYHYLLGELYAEKAARLTRREREQRLALVSAAREFMCVPLGTPASPLVANAYWHAGRCYYQARRYDGAGRALGEFTSKFGDDTRLSEALYLYGESQRRVGDMEGAARAFSRDRVEHDTDRFGYLAHLALGETYLEMGRLEAPPDAKDKSQNARAVFESIRRDPRYTPESEVWMKALFRLGQTYYLMGRASLDRVDAMRVEGKPEAAVAQQKTDAQSRFRNAAEVLEEFRERYPPADYGPDAAQGAEEPREGRAASQSGPRRPSFYEFLRRQRLPLLRMLAMTRLALEQNDLALRNFNEILQVTADPRAFVDRSETDEPRRLAFLYKGMLEMQKGRSTEKGKAVGAFEEAYRTFQQGHDEFVRTDDSALFSEGMAQAKESLGDRDSARRLYDQAHNELLKRQAEGKKAGAVSAAELLERKWILPPEDWAGQVAWARDTL